MIAIDQNKANEPDPKQVYAITMQRFTMELQRLGVHPKVVLKAVENMQKESGDE